MLDNSIVGKQIAFLRKQKDMTQEELAEKLGITAQAISKWENGHTLPETILLPLLAELFNSTIDAILMPFAARDVAFKNFVHANCCKYGDLAVQLYERLKEKFNFTVTYDDKFYIFEAVFNGGSAVFNVPDKEDFIIRIDVKTGDAGTENNMSVKIPLRNCSDYMDMIDKMPEHIKSRFRVSDCKSCTCNCPYCMAYCFEGVEYKQCHFIGISLDSVNNLEHILSLVFAENGKYIFDKIRAE